jgi:hypothetical protein
MTNALERAIMTTHQAEGWIDIVEEERFRLITDTGQGLLLTLAKGAPLEGRGLQDLHRANAHVRVEYEGEPNLESGVARDVRAITGVSGTRE